MLFISTLARAGTVTLDFESFADGTSLTNQYVGFLFTNASVFTAGLSLNELEFPPHSGTNVAVDAGGPITIGFTSPVLSFSGFFTYGSALTIDAFDSLNQSVGTTNSAFTSNFVSSGNPPNELLQVTFAGGISHVSITGDLAGSPFTLDDATVSTPTESSVPEPSSTCMVLACLLLVGFPAVRRSCIPIT
jgi:hypothetical protein